MKRVRIGIPPELLLNAVKHANVSEATVSVERDGRGCVRVVMSDEGDGFDARQALARRGSPSTFGLFSIQQRMVHVGGRMEIDSSPGQGTRVTLIGPGANASEHASAPTDEG